MVRRAAAEGHEVANHSPDHVGAAHCDAAGVWESMAQGADVVERLTGMRPRWYRPPRGEVTSATLLAARDLGQDVALWSVARGGPDGGAADEDAEGVRRHLAAAVRPGAVIGLHDGLGNTCLDGGPDSSAQRRREAELSVLPQVLAGWREAGYRFVTLSERAPAPTGTR